MIDLYLYTICLRDTEFALPPQYVRTSDLRKCILIIGAPLSAFKWAHQVFLLSNMILEIFYHFCAMYRIIVVLLVLILYCCTLLLLLLVVFISR